MLLKVKHGMAKSVDPEKEQSDQGLHCLLKHICPILGIFMVQEIKCLNKTFAMKQLSIKIYIQTAVNVSLPKKQLSK